ncbi:MAG TPA: MGMT family protein, partial [Amaricoccus sp.]
MGRRSSSIHVFGTAAGFCGIGWSEAGITCLELPARSAAAVERRLRRRLPGAEPAVPPAAVAAVAAAVRCYFAGERVDFSDVALDLDGQDPFFRRVYAAARAVGWGETTSYGALARAVGAGP